MADLVLRPWFDRVALHAIAHWYFPLSRAWAAAIASGGDLDAFADAAGPFRLPRAQINRMVTFALDRQRAYEAAATAWVRAFFAAEAPSPPRLRDVEEHRLLRAHAAMAARSAFMPLHFARRLPAVRWEIAGPNEVERRHGRRLAAPEAAFPAPALPAPEPSHQMPASDCRVGWLRFPTRVGEAADTAWARVATPLGVKDPPTLVFLHGIAMETEFWRGEGRMMLKGLTGAGVRLIQPEGPWHGRRRANGFYGGEPAMALGPLGMLDLFEAWLAETASIVAWARRTSRGPVAVGGVSLGALASQLLACAAAHWPRAMRPDALLLIATSGGVIDAAQDGGLAQALGAPERLAEEGWTAARLARYRPLLEPVGPPAVEPGRIVMVLGAEDEVTPFRGGAALARRWRLPSENVFVRPQGHFSVALGLSRRSDPLRRLLEILR